MTTLNPNYEQVLINTFRLLPPKKAKQLVDFAQFLEAQLLTETLIENETTAEIEADNAHWETLTSTDESQMLLATLAEEAIAEYSAGQTKTLAFDNTGKLSTE